MAKIVEEICREAEQVQIIERSSGMERSIEEA